MNTGLLIGSIFGIILFVFIIIIVVVVASSAAPAGNVNPSTGGGGNINPSTGGSVNPPSTCNLNCSDSGVLDSARQYYSTHGEYKNIYTITPTRGASAGSNQCDIAYNFTRRPEAADFWEPGTDKRRFTFNQGAGCTWTASAMAGSNTGTNV